MSIRHEKKINDLEKRADDVDVVIEALLSRVEELEAKLDEPKRKKVSNG